MVAHSCVAFADKSREQSRIREAGFVNRKFSLRTSIKGNYSSLLLDASSSKPFTLRPVTLHLSRRLKLASFKGPNLHGARNLDNGGRLNMGMRNIMEIFNGEGRRFDDSAQRSASNECVRLIRKLRWIGMDEEAERVLAQLSGWPFRPTETVIAGPWATD